MGKPAIRVSEAEAANDLRSLLVRVSAGAEFVIERNAEAVAVLRPAAPNIRLLSESLRLASERGSNTTLEVHSRTHTGDSKRSHQAISFGSMRSSAARKSINSSAVAQQSVVIDDVLVASCHLPSCSPTSGCSRLELGVVDQHERRGDAKPWALIAPDAGGVGRHWPTPLPPMTAGDLR